MLLPADHAFGDKLPSVTELTVLAGDFWYRFYRSKNQLAAINGGFQQEVRQLIREFHEAAAAGGFSTVPQYHTETYWPLLVDPGEVNKVPIAYGQGYNYGPFSSVLNSPAQIHYGDKRKWAWQIPLPEALMGLAGVSNETVHADSWYTEGLQTRIFKKDGRRFLELPVDPSTVYRQVVNQYGETRLLIWLYMAEFEKYTAASRYGVLFSRFMPSTTAFLAATESVMGAYTRGASEIWLRMLLAATVDEVVAEEGETVEQILIDHASPVVVTDRRSVFGHAGKTSPLSPGDKLSQGDFFFDTIELTDFTGGAPPWLENWTFPQQLTGLDSDIVIPGGTHNATVVQGEDGFTHISFDTGTPDFWDWVNGSHGEFANFVAQQLGIIAAPSGKIAPSYFPATMDVVGLLAKSPLISAISLSEIKSEFLVENATTLLRLHREVVPPWVTHIIQFNGNPPEDWNQEDKCTIQPLWV